MDEQDKLRQARIAANIVRAKQQRENEESNRVLAEQSFAEAWETMRKDVIEPTFTEFAAGLAKHDIPHEVATTASATEGVRGMYLRIGPPQIVGQPSRHVLFTMMPDAGAGRVFVSYDRIPAGKEMIGILGLNQINEKKVAGWLNDAFEKGGYAG